MEQELPHPSLADIRLDEVAESRWRVVDRRFRATNPRTLLGFIQQTDGRFEVTDVRRAGDPVFYQSREAAIAAFAQFAAASRELSFDSVGELHH